MRFSGRPGTWWEVRLLADAEFAEDQVHDVFARGGAGEGVQGVESFVEIEKNHLVMYGYGFKCSVESSKC